ncbi:MAG: queuosine salvage family protein [Patescibacteria group bacterium]|nr:queuosine salvage family protein [Patescibacteria group bacterium]
MNPVLKSIKPVIEKSKFIKINKENLLKFCSDFKLKKFKFWLDLAPFNFPKLNEKEWLNFIFVSSSLDFCFWGEPKWKIKYKGNFYDGSWGLVASLTRAIEGNFPILDFKYLAKIPENDLREIFKGNVEIPLFNERLKILRENGRILIEKFNGDFEKVIKKGREDALKLLEVITNDFPSFYDWAIYKGNKVFFHKRAQLLIADIHRRGLAKFKNIDKLTALADYKIPQILRKLGILEYAPDLAEKIDNKVLIPAGSEEEIEIRANTIWAIELMKDELKSRIQNITPMQIDSYLWLKSQEKSPDDKPYHLTKTIFY